MLALLDPSRQDDPRVRRVPRARSRRRRATSTAASAPGWLPIDLQVADNFPQSVAAYKQYDVLLVNAVFDGMNLVAKEGPLVNARDGVLVLSENAGAHEELGEWAVTVNPFDVGGQAEALHQALTMPEESGGARGAIRERCARTTSTKWVAGAARRPRRAPRPQPSWRMAVAATGELRVVNPATLELVGTVTTTDPSAVQAIVSEPRSSRRKLGRDVARGSPGVARAGARRRARARRRDRGHRRFGDGEAAVEAFTTELFPCARRPRWLADRGAGAARPGRVGTPSCI